MLRIKKDCLFDNVLKHKMNLQYVSVLAKRGVL